MWRGGRKEKNKQIFIFNARLDGLEPRQSLRKPLVRSSEERREEYLLKVINFEAIVSNFPLRPLSLDWINI